MKVGNPEYRTINGGMSAQLFVPPVSSLETGNSANVKTVERSPAVAATRSILLKPHCMTGGEVLARRAQT
jgi:hypothetical protein